MVSIFVYDATLYGEHKTSSGLYSTTSSGASTGTSSGTSSGTSTGTSSGTIAFPPTPVASVH